MHAVQIPPSQMTVCVCVCVCVCDARTWKLRAELMAQSELYKQLGQTSCERHQATRVPAR